jgi:hypothetical protein
MQNGRRTVWVGVAGAAALALSGGTLAQDAKTPFAVAFALCADPPADIQIAREALWAAGWHSTEQASVIALTNAGIVTLFDETDLERTIVNAGFMAGSILGNSPLGPDQIGMETDDHFLALIGIPEGWPYCVIAGPPAVFEQLRRLDNLETWAGVRTDILTRMTSVYDNRLIAIGGELNLPELERRLAETDLSEDDISAWRPFLAPATAYIRPMEPQE